MLSKGDVKISKRGTPRLLIDTYMFIAESRLSAYNEFHGKSVDTLHTSQYPPTPSQCALRFGSLLMQVIVSAGYFNFDGNGGVLAYLPVRFYDEPIHARKERRHSFGT